VPLPLALSFSLPVATLLCDPFVLRDRDCLSYLILSYLAYPKAESAPQVDSAEPSHSYPPTPWTFLSLPRLPKKLPKPAISMVQPSDHIEVLKGEHGRQELPVLRDVISTRVGTTCFLYERQTVDVSWRFILVQKEF
jgi:hypothetical protein